MKKLFALVLALSMLLCSVAHADLFGALSGLKDSLQNAGQTENPVTTEPETEGNFGIITRNTDAQPGTLAVTATNVTSNNSEKYASGYYNAVVYNGTDSVVSLDDCQLVIKDEAGNELKVRKYVSVYPMTLNPGEYGLVNESYSFSVGTEVSSASAPLTFEFTLNQDSRTSKPAVKLDVANNVTTSEVRYSSTYFYVSADITNSTGADVAGLKGGYILLDGNNNLIYCNTFYLDDDWIIRAGDSISLTKQCYSEVSNYCLTNNVTPATVLFTVMAYGADR